MILAWVLSLLLLVSSLVAYLERMTALSIIEKNGMTLAHRNFIAAEKSVLECEENISQLAVLTQNHCFIQSVGKNIWLISSKQKPSIQVQISRKAAVSPARQQHLRGQEPALVAQLLEPFASLGQKGMPWTKQISRLQRFPAKSSLSVPLTTTYAKG